MTNCSECGLKIDTLTSPDNDQGHMCFDCYFEYKLMRGDFNVSN